ncbi:hypothetical protein Agub_g1128 [Astrephomene gubernaculifera]|uniref:ABC transporter domain-containing protein n=1 Tax=Astrephomene gubernaculifera TaxID=47775 RepID=A0AAD3DH33_9CHLO|nr:hypothetical protein Agub_g1128 [Astrephomene gubernaculifera]
MLAWYLDKVLPKSYGQRLPWWFVFDRRYWSSSGSSSSSTATTTGSSHRSHSGSSSRNKGGQQVNGNGGSMEGSGSGGRKWGWGWRSFSPFWRGGSREEEDAGSRAGLGEPLLQSSRRASLAGDDTAPATTATHPAAATSTPAAVEVRGLVKTYRSASGGPPKVAVAGLDLRIESGRITALLGHNGAGKTTTIHVLTGMLQPTAGSATVNGFDVATQMDQVRASLGICPQFDILWPDLSVYEHLQLYGAIKGYSGGELHEAAVSAASGVGLLPKLHCPAGELSGGQRRKLSVAIALMGDPAVVFLDEPTSGMDPFSRRFTWDVIRRHRQGAAVVLTTHSMEEADLLGDRVVIMARGRVAAQGTGMELKAAHGVGYNLTLVMDTSAPPHLPAAAAAAVQQLQQQQQPHQEQSSSVRAAEEEVAALQGGGSGQQAGAQPAAAAEAPPGTSSSSTTPRRRSSEGGGGGAPAATSPGTSSPVMEATGAPASSVGSITRTSASKAAAAAAAVTSSAVQVLDAVRQFVPAAVLVSAAGAEVVVRLPREAGGAFPGLLRALDGPMGRQLGVASYGLSLTTLEEVFLAITAAADQQAAAEAATATATPTVTPTITPTVTSVATDAVQLTTAAAAAATAAGSISPLSPPSAAAATPPSAPSAATDPQPPPPLQPPQRLHGWRLYGQQLRALLTKRALCARRDRLAVVTQLLVPLALVYLALWISSLQVREPSEPPLRLSRTTALIARPPAWSAAAALRNDSSSSGAGGGGCAAGASRGGGGGEGAAAAAAAAAAAGGGCLAAFLAGHPAGDVAIDSGATALYTGDPRVRNATLESYLLAHWYGGGNGGGAPVYDAIHMTSLPPPAVFAAAGGATAATAASAAVAAAAPPLSFVLLTNQSALSALPAALADAMTAALSYIGTGLPPPATPSPPPLTVTEAAGELQQQPQQQAASRQHLLRRLAAAADNVRHGDEIGPASETAAAASTPSPSSSPSFSTVSWPMPTLPFEPVARIQRDAASLMLVLCLVLASSVLSASFVVFLVREQDSNSKHLQLVSGAPPSAYWLANYLWDCAAYCASAAGLLALIGAYRLPQYSGQRLAATAGLLGGFGPAGLSLTYLLHFLFRDEMRALQRLNTAYFLTGYLGFVATWVADLILMIVPQPGRLAAWNSSVKWALRTASPHYCFARGMYDVQNTYNAGLFPFGKRGKPFDWDVFGSPMAHMAAQTLVYGTLAVLYDTGLLSAVHARMQDGVAAVMTWLGGQRRGPGGVGSMPLVAGATAVRDNGSGGSGGGVGGNGAVAGDGSRAGQPDTECGGDAYGSCYEDDDDADGGYCEDVDVGAERRAVLAGRRSHCQVLLSGVRKSYPRGLFRRPLAAVRGLWLGVPAGECFGLLGVNGAGKTTTFRMLTGEVLPDAGDAAVGGRSVRRQLAAARRQLGYCPQFEALPGAMTGREVVAMYARLRGVPEPQVAPLARQLLQRLGLGGAAAEGVCGGYSGGMRRKLGVGVALVGEPPVVALDEPSTGMDPGGRRGLWSCLQSEVIGAGRTVILTSHSMEECEALCGRLTIMAGGRLRCLGTPQHLKGRFGGGPPGTCWSSRPSRRPPPLAPRPSLALLLVLLAKSFSAAAVVLLPLLLVRWGAAPVLARTAAAVLLVLVVLLPPLLSCWVGCAPSAPMRC